MAEIEEIQVFLCAFGLKLVAFWRWWAVVPYRAAEGARPPSDVTTP